VPHSSLRELRGGKGRVVASFSRSGDSSLAMTREAKNLHLNSTLHTIQTHATDLIKLTGFYTFCVFALDFIYRGRYNIIRGIDGHMIDFPMPIWLKEK
jgi:hypothetical protein